MTTDAIILVQFAPPKQVRWHAGTRHLQDQEGDKFEITYPELYENTKRYRNPLQPYVSCFGIVCHILYNGLCPACFVRYHHVQPNSTPSRMVITPFLCTRDTS
jgi:hypothetical protein